MEDYFYAIVWCLLFSILIAWDSPSDSTIPRSSAATGYNTPADLCPVLPATPQDVASPPGEIGQDCIEHARICPNCRAGRSCLQADVLRREFRVALDGTQQAKTTAKAPTAVRRYGSVRADHLPGLRIGADERVEQPTPEARQPKDSLPQVPKLLATVPICSGE